MTKTDAYFKDIKQVLDYGDEAQIIKRLIDLTLDTLDVSAYSEMMQLIQDTEKASNKDESSAKYQSIYDKLVRNLETRKLSSYNKPMVDAKGISKTYSNSNFTLGPVDFQLHAGEIIGLVGENGNGKTTLLRMVFGDLRLDKGTLGFNFYFDDNYDKRSQIIYIPQRTESWRGMIMDHLQFTALCYGVKGDENPLITDLVLARLGMRKFRNYTWGQLSSGYKMRFELARALLRMPKLLLIDEPLANLDVLAQNTVLEDFKNISASPFRPLGIMLSSQQLYEVEKTADNVIFLKDGSQKTLYEDSAFEETEKNFIVEFEADVDQETMLRVLQAINIISLQKNGRTYIGIFPKKCTLKSFLNTLIQSDINVVYFRDITNSSRRFFLS